MWIWARKEWIWTQVKFTDDDQTTVPYSKLYSTNDGVKSCNNFFCFLWIYYSVRQKVLFTTSPRFHPTNSTNSSKKSSWWNDCSTKWIWESYSTVRNKISEVNCGKMPSVENTYRVVPGHRNHFFWPSQRVSKHTLMKSEPSQPVSCKRGL